MISIESEQLIAWITQATAAVAAATAAYQKIGKPLLAGGRRLVSMHDDIVRISAELRTNGGATLRDGLDRIERRQVLADARQKMLLNDVPGKVILEMDQAGQCTYISRPIMGWTGRTQAEMLHDGWFSAVWPQDRERVIREWHACLSQSRNFDEQFAIVGSDALPVRVSMRAYPVENEDGKTIGWVGKLERGEARSEAPK